MSCYFVHIWLLTAVCLTSINHYEWINKYLVISSLFLVLHIFVLKLYLLFINKCFGIFCLQNLVVMLFSPPFYQNLNPQRMFHISVTIVLYCVFHMYGLSYVPRFMFVILGVMNSKDHFILSHFFLQGLRVNGTIYIKVLDRVVTPWFNSGHQCSIRIALLDGLRILLS